MMEKKKEYVLNSKSVTQGAHRTIPTVEGTSKIAIAGWLGENQTCCYEISVETNKLEKDQKGSSTKWNHFY